MNTYILPCNFFCVASMFLRTPRSLTKRRQPTNQPLRQLFSERIATTPIFVSTTVSWMIYQGQHNPEFYDECTERKAATRTGSCRLHNSPVILLVDVQM